MIYMDADGDAAKKKKWLTLGTGFRRHLLKSRAGAVFRKNVVQSMPGKKIASIKSGWRNPPDSTPVGYRQFQITAPEARCTGI